MKKKVSGRTIVKIAGLPGLALALALLCAGCVTNKVVYDKTVPAEQRAILEFASSLKVTLFDGHKVSWKAGLFTRWYAQGLGKVVVTIPAGEHTLTADYWIYSESYQGTYTVQQSQSTDNISITFDFQPGRTYRMDPSFAGGRVYLEIREAAAK